MGTSHSFLCFMGKPREGETGRRALGEKREQGRQYGSRGGGHGRPVVEGMGLELWDVVFEKEGADWNLCLLIDKEGGVDLEDCEKVSREIDPKLDEMDPIEQSYYLVVSSPGVNRLLTKPEHFARYQGSPVLVRTIRPVEGAPGLFRRPGRFFGRASDPGNRRWEGHGVRPFGDGVCEAGRF